MSEAVIEGKKVTVIFDTGAPGLVLNSNHYFQKSTASIPCSGINGSFSCSEYKISKWTWMDVAQKNTTAFLSDLTFLEKALGREVHALIGLSALENFFVSLDFDHMSITLSERMKVEKQSALRFQYADHLPVINCRVNGVKKKLALDTGSGINYLFSHDNSENENWMTETSPVIVTGTENAAELKHGQWMDLNVADQFQYTSEFIFDPYKTGSFQPTTFDGLLGQPFLQKFNITIHPAKQIIILTARAEGNDVSGSLTAQF